MLKNYILVAFRNISKNKFQSFINVFSLSIGLCLCILISLFVYDELSYDSHHSNADRIYRVLEQEFDEDNKVVWAGADGEIPLGPEIIQEIPEIEAYTRINSFEGNTKSGTQLFKDEIIEADPGLFQMFSFNFIQGNPNTAFNDIHNAVFTKTMAEKYFGLSNPLNQTIEIKIGQEFQTFKVSGVVEDIPENNTIKFGICIPFENLKERSSWIAKYWNAWSLSGFPTYVMLRKGQMPSEKAMSDFYLSRHFFETERMREQGDLAEDELQNYTYALQNLRDIHLNPEVSGGLSPISDPKYSIILTSIALFILLIACVNYINLNVARSVSRSTEVGIRKVVGASRSQIIRQFLSESMLITIMAFLLALLLVDLLLPEFNYLVDKSLEIQSLWTSEIFLVLVVLLILSGLLSGAYPALFISSINVQSIFKGKVKAGGNNKFTYTLIGLQFLLASLFLSGNFILNKQLNFMRNKNLGFKGEQVIRFGISEDNLRKLQSSLTSNSDVIEIQAMSHAIGRGRINTNIEYKGDDSQTANIFGVEHDFIDMMEMKLVSGRNFDINKTGDTSLSVIVNQSFVNEFIGGSDPLSAEHNEINVMGFDMDKVRIIGVVEDFIYSSAGDKIEPAVLMANSSTSKRIGLAKINMQNADQAISAIEKSWYELFPNTLFEYSFISNDMDNLYKDEKKWSSITNYATLSSVLISLLGIFGMASVLLVNRTKELGIRKVLGAGIKEIFILLSKQYVLPFFLAFGLSIPICIYFSEQWLMNYHNRVNLEFMDFALAAIIMLFSISITILFFTYRGNRINPVEALRDD